MLDGVHLRVFACDDEDRVEPERAYRVGFDGDLVERQVAPHRPLVLHAEVAVLARVHARVADVERRIHAYGLSVVSDPVAPRDFAHLRHEIVCRGTDQIQEVEPAWPLLRERLHDHLARRTAAVVLNLPRIVFKQWKHFYFFVLLTIAITASLICGIYYIISQHRALVGFCPAIATS